MIVSFANQKTTVFYDGMRFAACSSFARTASRKLDQLDAAININDLDRPSNHLEVIKGNRKGQWEIRINDQWSLCFRSPENNSGPTDVEIVNYH